MRSKGTHLPVTGSGNRERSHQQGLRKRTPPPATTGRSKPLTFAQPLRWVTPWSAIHGPIYSCALFSRLRNITGPSECETIQSSAGCAKDPPSCAKNPRRAQHLRYATSIKRPILNRALDPPEKYAQASYFVQSKFRNFAFYNQRLHARSAITCDNVPSIFHRKGHFCASDGCSHSLEIGLIRPANRDTPASHCQLYGVAT